MTERKYHRSEESKKVFFIQAKTADRCTLNRLVHSSARAVCTEGLSQNNIVTPAQAGVQKTWIPASAGMTMKDFCKTPNATVVT
jgi:hypothetical protein